VVFRGNSEWFIIIRTISQVAIVEYTDSVTAESCEDPIIIRKSGSAKVQLKLSSSAF
jgi:hypothetical protein